MKRTLAQASALNKPAKVEITSFFKKVKVELDVKLVESEEKENTKPVRDSVLKDDKFNKEKWVHTLDQEHKLLLQLEINTIEDSWLLLMHKEFTKPYFLKLKEFVLNEQKINTIFPPANDIYSWSRLTPLNKTNVLIIGQDPYHNHNQAHGLAFSVQDPKTKIPPSLQNIYKTIKEDYPDFVIPKRNANLTPWAEGGVLMLNTCLTVKAHNANSHANKGWEIFTKQVVNNLIQYKKANNDKLCIMCWGGPAQKLLTDIKKQVGRIESDNLLILKSCHPSPLSAHRGDFFHCHHFQNCNEWLGDSHAIPWTSIKD